MVKLLPPMLKEGIDLHQWFGLILMQLANFFTFTLFISPIFYIIVWLNKFCTICETFKHQSHLITHHCRKCIELFSAIKKAFSMSFLYLFSFCQIFIIANSFNIISTALMDQYSTTEKILMSVSYFCIALHLILIVLSLTLSVEKAFGRLKMLASSIKDDTEGIAEDDKTLFHISFSLYFQFLFHMKSMS